MCVCAAECYLCYGDIYTCLQPLYENMQPLRIQNVGLYNVNHQFFFSSRLVLRFRLGQVSIKLMQDDVISLKVMEMYERRCVYVCPKALQFVAKTSRPASKHSEDELQSCFLAKCHTVLSITETDGSLQRTK